MENVYLLVFNVLKKQNKIELGNFVNIYITLNLFTFL